MLFFIYYMGILGVNLLLVPLGGMTRKVQRLLS